MLLGFILGCAWLILDPSVRVETKDKVIVRVENLPEVFQEYYYYKLNVGTPEQCSQIK